MKSMTKELTPLESDSFYHSLRRMIQYIPLDSSKWSAFLTLKRLTWLIEDEDEDTIEAVRNAVSSYESLEENMISDYLIADDTTDWLKEEWSIGDNKNVCAFVDRDDFMRSLTRNDHEQSKYIVQFFEKCWNIACIEEKYQKWILNQEYENINFWFFKGDIYVVDPDFWISITFKKNDAERIFTPSQLDDFVDLDAVNIDEDCCLMTLSQITKYGVEDDYPTYLVQDLVDFWELPSDCLKYAINY